MQKEWVKPRPLYAEFSWLTHFHTDLNKAFAAPVVEVSIV